MTRIVLQKSEESTKLFERLSSKSGKGPIGLTHQWAKSCLCHAQHVDAALGCVTKGVEINAENQAPATGTGSQTTERVEVDLEKKNPLLDKTGEKNVNRKNPSLTDPG
jgi:hypothetical protein